MLLSKVPKFAGILTDFSMVVTGKAGGVIVSGSPVGSADGTAYTALAGDPTDIAGIAVFDPVKEASGFVLNDVVSVCVFGVVSAKASAAIAAGARLTGAAAGKVVSSANPGVATTKKYLGVALSDAAADGDIIWMLVMPEADTGT